MIYLLLSDFMASVDAKTLVPEIAALIIAVFAYFSTRKNQSELARHQAAIKKFERLEVSRSEGYEEIWKLTDSLNLFGPTTEPNTEDLSTRLKDWYFKHGLFLGKDSKKRYFLVQEILNYATLKSAIFRRPAANELYGSSERPIKVLRELRSELLGAKTNSGEVSKLNSYVDIWKEKPNQKDAEKNWVLLQFVLSKFRSGLIKDLGFDDEEAENEE